MNPIQTLRTLLVLAILSALLPGCSPYRLAVVDSAQVPVNKNTLFLYEESPLLISYDFWSHLGMPAIRIENISDQPVSINWEDSFFDVGNDTLRCFMTISELKRYDGLFLPPLQVPRQVISPGEFLEIEGYPFVQKKRYKKQPVGTTNTFDESIATMIFNLNYDQQGIEQMIKNDFWIAGTYKLKRRTLRAIRKSNEAPYNQFFIDKRDPETQYLWGDVLIVSLETLIYSL